jgi:hypothetical protein
VRQQGRRESKAMADAVETNNNNQLYFCGAYIAVLLAVSRSALSFNSLESHILLDTAWQTRTNGANRSCQPVVSHMSAPLTPSNPACDPRHSAKIPSPQYLRPSPMTKTFTTPSPKSLLPTSFPPQYRAHHYSVYHATCAYKSTPSSSRPTNRSSGPQNMPPTHSTLNSCAAVAQSMKKQLTCYTKQTPSPSLIPAMQTCLLTL